MDFTQFFTQANSEGTINSDRYTHTHIHTHTYY